MGIERQRDRFLPPKRKTAAIRTSDDRRPYYFFRTAAYIPAGFGFAGSNFATWIFSARPILPSSQIP